MADHEISDGQRRVDYLDGRRFSASQVKEAASINEHTLTNLINKSDIILCSERPGQGRARQFCLIDVYQLSLVREMVKATNDVSWSVHNANFVLFSYASEAYVTRDNPFGSTERLISEVDTARAKMCKSIKNAPAEYYTRGKGLNYVAIASFGERFEAGVDVHSSDAWDVQHALSHTPTSIIWSLTLIFGTVDRRLMQLLV